MGKRKVQRDDDASDNGDNGGKDAGDNGAGEDPQAELERLRKENAELKKKVEGKGKESKRKESTPKKAKVKALATDEEDVFPISDAKRATVKLYNGRVIVNLREYYEKEGEWLPGKKGIALTSDQWRELAKAADDVDAAVKQKNEKFSADIGEMRRVTVSSYSKNLLVNVREYYKDKTSGEEKPGSKGLALRVVDWSTLQGLIVDITKAIDKREKVQDDDDD